MLRGSSPGGLSKWSPAIAKVNGEGFWWWEPFTLPKFNSESTPEKLQMAPIGKDRLPLFVRGELLNFGGGGIYINDFLAGGFFFTPFWGRWTHFELKI